MRGALDRLCVAIATGLYLSYIPCWLAKGTRWEGRRWTGAGFLGTAIGAALVGLLPEACGAQALFLAAAALLACAASGRAEARLGRHDDPRILIDETVGYWTAVLCLPRTLPVLASAFVLFRVFDAKKLPPWRWLERLPGGFGVVMDDVGAGAAANLLLRLGLLLLAAPAAAQIIEPAPQPPAQPVAVSSVPAYGTPIPADRGPWVLGDVRFAGHRNVSDLALQNRVRARRGVIYAPSDLKDDAAEIATLPNVRSVEPLLFAMPEPVPDTYAAIAVSSMLVRVVYRIEEETLALPGMSKPAAAADKKEPEKKEAKASLAEPPVSMSGVILTPTAYRGTDRLNRPGLGLDVNAAYYIGRLYGKNSLPYTTKKTNFIDRLGIWLLTMDGKMQVQSETTWRPALAAGAQTVFHFRDSQPTLQTPTASVNVSEKTTRIMTGTYAVASKKVYGVRSSLGFMYGNAGDQTGLLSEFFTSQALLFGGHPNQVAASKTTLFASLLYALRPDYPIGLEIIKPNGMPLAPVLINFKLGRFLKLNFDVAYLRFQGGWDMLGLFQFRYTHFPKR